MEGLGLFQEVEGKQRGKRVKLTGLEAELEDARELSYTSMPATGQT